jgi:hypothetical protein
MSAIEKATAQFRERLNGELQSIEVPEWSDKDNPFKIYFKPLINFKAQEKIYALVNAGKASEAICQTLVIRALDIDGKHIFRQHDIQSLMHESDPDVVGRIIQEMTPDADDAEMLKKS